jgi:hypothetical protein
VVDAQDLVADRDDLLGGDDGWPHQEAGQIEREFLGLCHPVLVAEFRCHRGYSIKVTRHCVTTQ